MFVPPPRPTYHFYQPHPLRGVRERSLESPVWFPGRALQVVGVDEGKAAPPPVPRGAVVHVQAVVVVALPEHREVEVGEAPGPAAGAGWLCPRVRVGIDGGVRLRRRNHERVGGVIPAWEPRPDKPGHAVVAAARLLLPKRLPHNTALRV